MKKIMTFTDRAALLLLLPLALFQGVLPSQVTRTKQSASPTKIVLVVAAMVTVTLIIGAVVRSKLIYSPADLFGNVIKRHADNFDWPATDVKRPGFKIGQIMPYLDAQAEEACAAETPTDRPYKKLQWCTQAIGRTLETLKQGHGSLVQVCKKAPHGSQLKTDAETVRTSFELRIAELQQKQIICQMFIQWKCHYIDCKMNDDEGMDKLIKQFKSCNQVFGDSDEGIAGKRIAERLQRQKEGENEFTLASSDAAGAFEKELEAFMGHDGKKKK